MIVSHLQLFPKKAIEKRGFIKRLIGLSSCPTVKLHYQLCRVFHFASRCIHMRADLQLVAASGDAEFTQIEHQTLHENHPVEESPCVLE